MSSLQSLEKRAILAASAYYNGSAPIMTDAEFDSLVEEIRAKDPTSAILTRVGAPVKGAKAKLPYPMMSLDKVREGTARWASSRSGPFIVSDKLDGTSAMFVAGKLYRRGTGVVGADVSGLVGALLTRKSLSTQLAVRGEIIIPRAKFDRTFARDARSAVNALVTRSHVPQNDPILRAAKFVAYEVVHPRMDKRQQLTALKKAGFECAWHKTLDSVSDTELSALFQDRRANSAYDVDGLVVAAAGVHELSSARNPTHAFAFKEVLADQGAVTTVREVVYAASASNRLVPRVRFDPITLVSGVTLQWATAHNARFVKDNGIGAGAKVRIVRSGDVIPKIQEIVNGVRTPALPPAAPAWSWDASGVHAVLSETGPGARAKRMLAFLNALGVENIGGGTVDRLFAAGVDSIPKLVEATGASLQTVPGFGKVSATRLADSLRAKLNGANLATLMHASGAFSPALGETKLQSVAKVIVPGDLGAQAKRKNIKDRMMSAPGLGGAAASAVEDGMAEFLDLMKAIGINVSKLVTQSAGPKTDPAQSSNVANGVAKGVVVFSGFRDKQLEANAIHAGWIVRSSVSANTSMVVAEDPTSASAKVTKAKALDVPVTSRTAFADLVAISTMVV